MHDASDSRSIGVGVQSPRDLPTPEPHLPLRKSSAANRMQSRKGSTIPNPIFAPSHNHHHHHHHHHPVRGFDPSPVQPVPQLNHVQASSEHAFAAREQRRAYKPAMAVLESQHDVLQYANDPTHTSQPALFRPPPSPSTPLHSPSPHSPRPALSLQTTPRRLKQTKSVGDGLRTIRHRMSGKVRSSQLTPDPHSIRASPALPVDEVRDSFRSALTSNSSFGHTSSVLTTPTTHTSLSSTNGSDVVKIRTTDYDEEEGGLTDLDMSVDDVLGMYEAGFESGPGSVRPSPRPSMQSATRPSFEARPSSMRSVHISARHSMDALSLQSLDRPQSQPTASGLAPQRPHAAHRRSQSASILILGVNSHRTAVRGISPAPTEVLPEYPKPKERSSDQIISGNDLESRSSTGAPAVTARDRYGFKKATHYITVQQYDSWNAEYTQYLDRRRKKWHAMMHQYGYETDPAIRFPQKSEKIKRYVRKGIPPEFRGAAWWWYARGPRELAKNPTLYAELRERVESGELTDNDREHIERDLNRTFPDNVRFKPDPTAMHDAQAGAGGGGTPSKEGSNLKNEVSAAPADTPLNGSPDNSIKKKNRRYTEEPETPILQSLRKVLQAFAVYNPKVGYCQSLNFIAGLLLLFLSKDDSDLDEAEPKAFILLNIVTTHHLPDTHGITLEGANIDIGVLMSCIKDSLPAIWNKLDDQKELNAIGVSAAAGGIGVLRLPTVSLATTAWFMSLFVGTLPIESVLRVWDCLFLDGSKTLFRIALAIFKAGEPDILKVSDPMEIFQVVQTIPRGMLDANSLLEVCFRRRGGFAGISQDVVNRRRKERQRLVQEGIMRQGLGARGEDMVRRMKTRLRTRGGGN